MDNKVQHHVFVLMPFASRYDQLWSRIDDAAKAAGAKAERVDKQLYEEDVLNRIIGQIEKADAIVAVMTGRSPNVFFEVGIAHALRKHVVLLTANPDDIPFDVAHLKHVPYKTAFLRPGELVDAETLTATLTDELKFALSTPRVSDSYYQEYKKAAIEMESVACGLAPYFTPIATRYFNEWNAFVKSLVNEGISTKGPERLEITRLLVHAMHRYCVVERIIGDPDELNSNDWILFYDSIRDDSIEKIWVLFADEALVASRIGDVAASWRFRKDKHFETRYCSPSQLLRAMGGRLPNYDVMEDFGEFVKCLRLRQGTYSYTPQEAPNDITTIFKPIDQDHKRLMKSLIDCSKNIDQHWLEKMKLGQAAPSAGTLTR